MMFHLVIDTIGMALFIGCYAYAVSSEPPLPDDEVHPGGRRRFASLPGPGGQPQFQTVP